MRCYAPPFDCCTVPIHEALGHCWIPTGLTAYCPTYTCSVETELASAKLWC